MYVRKFADPLARSKFGLEQRITEALAREVRAFEDEIGVTVERISVTRHPVHVLGSEHPERWYWDVGVDLSTDEESTP